MDKIKTCPCCGFQGSIEETNYSGAIGMEYHIICNECGLSTGTYEHKQDAVYVWNKRVNNG